jgi:hypothetical protein
LTIYEACSNDTHSGIVLVKEERLLKIVTTDVEAGIPLAHQLMAPLCKELHRLLLEPLHHCTLDIFDSNIHSTSLGAEHMEVTW